MRFSEAYGLLKYWQQWESQGKVPLKFLTVRKQDKGNNDTDKANKKNRLATKPNYVEVSGDEDGDGDEGEDSESGSSSGLETEEPLVAKELAMPPLNKGKGKEKVTGRSDLTLHVIPG